MLLLKGRLKLRRAGASVDLSEDLAILEPSLTLELFEEAGFTSPVLKDTIFSGLVFQFISFFDQNEANIYQWNLLMENSISVPFIKLFTPRKRVVFKVICPPRARVGPHSVGTINEVNNYGDASFTSIIKQR